MQKQYLLGLLGALLVTLLGATGLALAQDKTLVWKRYDVDLEVLQNSDILVEETQQINFTSGSFRFGFAAIPLDRVENIVDVSVSEIVNGTERNYTPNSIDPYGFTANQTNNNLEITWYFPPTSNSSHTYILRYRVEGGLRIYPKGDQLWWKAIPPDHNFPIYSSKVVVNLPQRFRKDELVVDSYGAPPDDAAFTEQGQVVFTASDISAGQELEVRVQFPPGVVQGSPPSWQTADDFQREWGPVFNLFAGAIAIFLLGAGPVAIILLWYTRGQDKKTPVVAEYITEPPSDLPAALAGTLVDEHADMEDIIASLLDLAQRGAIRMDEQATESKWGFGVSREFTFYLEDESKAIYPHEKRLLKGVFASGGTMQSERRMQDLKQKFYTAIPDIKKMLYDEVVEQEYFPKNPEHTRQMWRLLGAIGTVVAIGSTFCTLMVIGKFAPGLACIPASIVISMLLLLIVGKHMPRKTETGAIEAAKWLAFKKYLENIEKHQDLATVKEKFERYLPYAMAFGLERSLIHKFSKIDTPAPMWWGPRPYYHHPYGRRGSSTTSVESMGGAPGPLAGEGGGMSSLSDVSGGLGSSLSNMSDGLGSLLSSASSTFTSTPPPARSSSSSSFGGGGFSGGGSFGGGGGGGGSRGFG